MSHKPSTYPSPLLASTHSGQWNHVCTERTGHILCILCLLLIVELTKLTVSIIGCCCVLLYQLGKWACTKYYRIHVFQGSNITLAPLSRGCRQTIPSDVCPLQSQNIKSDGRIEIQPAGLKGTFRFKPYCGPCAALVVVSPNSPLALANRKFGQGGIHFCSRNLPPKTYTLSLAQLRPKSPCKTQPIFSRVHQQKKGRRTSIKFLPPNQPAT